MAKDEILQESQANLDADKLAAERKLDAAIPDLLAQSASDEVVEESVESLKAVDALGGLLLCVPMACSVFGLKQTAQVWTNERCSNLAGAMVPVLRKYPFGQKLLAFVENGAGVEELALMTILAPLVVQTYSAYQLDKQAIEAAAANAAKEVQENVEHSTN